MKIEYNTSKWEPERVASLEDWRRNTGSRAAIVKIAAMGSNAAVLEGASSEGLPPSEKYGSNIMRTLTCKDCGRSFTVQGTDRHLCPDCRQVELGKDAANETAIIDRESWDGEFEGTRPYPGKNNSRPTYAEVYQTIASNASDALVSFADKWSRFPVGSNAAFILERLQSALDWHRGFAGTVRAEVIAKLTAAIDEITLQAHGTV